MEIPEVIELIRANIIGTKFAEKSFLVGGFVRDLLLKQASDDIDIVVELPDGGRELAKFLHEKGIASHPVIYDNFGTALVNIGEHKIEFVMTRRESYRAKNRKPDVLFGSLREDVFRRDFTINSLIQDLVSGEILDLSGKGLSDLKDGIIRSTSQPEIIFKEDPLRLLRAVRFTNRFHFSLEEQTRQGILKNAEMLDYISWERRRDELLKMLIESDPVPALEMLVEFGLMPYLIPELLPMIGLAQGRKHCSDAWGHTMLVLQNTRPDQKLRLAALLHDIGKPLVRSENETGIHFYHHENAGTKLASKILTRLKIPSDLSRDILLLIRLHMRLKQSGKKAEIISDAALRRLIVQAGSSLDLLLELIHADNLSHATEFNLPDQIAQVTARLKPLVEEIIKHNLPLTGKDLILRFGLEPGEEIGNLLDKATEIWLESPQIKKEELLMKLEKEVNHG
ncbi:MAG TPA: HD domain-containing protein [Candidatus Cloacimonadota bacterium]|nr:HD domain-containing protein [Candidatus Cloacimonadota bacterium]